MVRHTVTRKLSSVFVRFRAPLQSMLLECAFKVFLGWFMVRSGLINNPDVSHFRLALQSDFCIYHFILLGSLDLIPIQIEKQFTTFKKQLRDIRDTFLINQIIYGGFVAGLNAG
jgi:cytochrome c oxidase assembly protein subunit 15